MRAKHSIARTSSSRLRLLPAYAQLRRYVAGNVVALSTPVWGQIVFVIAACCLTSGCGQEASGAKQAIERELKDPESVQYRDVRTFSGGIVCGEFNAKNSLGGYVGFSPFVFNAPGLGDLDSRASPIKVAAWCNSSPVRTEAIKRMCDQSLANPHTQVALGCEIPASSPVSSRAGR